MRTGPRSSFSLLPSQVRFRMIFLLDDGATFDAVAADPEIAEAYRSRGLTLTRSSVSRIKTCKEFKEIVGKRRKQQLDIRADQLTTALLRDSHVLETVSDRVKVELMKAVSELSDLSDNPDLPDGDRVKALQRLAQSVAALTNPAKDNQIAELKHKLREKDDEIESKNAEIERLKAEHKAEIERLTAKDNTVADPSRVADELSNLLGVKK